MWWKGYRERKETISLAVRAMRKKCRAFNKNFHNEDKGRKLILSGGKKI